MFTGAFFPLELGAAHRPRGTSGLRLAPGAAARAVYGHPVLFSLVLFYTFGFYSRAFHALRARGCGRGRVPVMLGMLLSGTELMSDFPVP